jgi:outer membrane murein-binding lipoprotein Lpp
MPRPFLARSANRRNLDLSCGGNVSPSLDQRKGLRGMPAMTAAVTRSNIVIALLVVNLAATAIAIAFLVDGRRDADARMDRTETNVRFLAAQDARLRAGRRNAARRLTAIEDRLGFIEPDVKALQERVETFAEDSTARGNAVQFQAWSDLCFDVHDLGGLLPEDVERFRLAVLNGCDGILGRG